MVVVVVVDEMKFKITKVKGIQYLQIWEDKMLMHCGSAKKVYKKLVKLQKMEIDHPD